MFADNFGWDTNQLLKPKLLDVLKIFTIRLF